MGLNRLAGTVVSLPKYHSLAIQPGNNLSGEKIVLIRKLCGSLVGVLFAAQAAWAAPAIQNPNFISSEGGWTTVTGSGASNAVLFDQANPNVLGGDPSYGLVVSRGGAANGSTRTEFFSSVTSGGQSIADRDGNFGSALDGTRFAGVYQAFTTGKAGSISFDAAAFSNQATVPDGDPFAFIFNTDDNTGTFVRGGTVVTDFTGVLPDGTQGSGPLLTGAQRPTPTLTIALGPGNNAARLAGATYTFNNLVAGNYIIGFGYAAQNAVSYYGGFAINNITDPGVPEIDTASAGLPFAIVCILFFVLSDRRSKELQVTA